MKHIPNNILKLGIILSVFLGINHTINAQCYGATATDMEFTSSGGSLSRTIQIPNNPNCSGGTWTIDGVPSWLTSASISGTTVYAVAPAYSGNEREGTINLYRNGSISGGIRVWQNKGNVPPPEPCIVSGFIGSTFIATGETKMYTLSYSNCPTQSYFTFKDQNGNNLPNWVSISQTSTSQVSVTFAANNTAVSRNVIIAATAQSSGVSGFGNSFTQPCMGKTWYADNDNDGFRDPGSVGQVDCANRGNGWTQNTTVDVCPTEYNLQNVLKTWYQDTDNDNFKDPGGETRQQCNKPAGGWTSNPESVDDNCPTQPYSSNGGCDPNCGITLPSNTLLEFGTSGGTQTIPFTVQQGCSGYALTFGNYPNWLTVSYTPGSITIVCQPYAQFREASGIGIYSNGSIQGGFAVKQNYVPPPCIVSGFNGSSILANGEMKTFNLSYQDCPTESYYTFKDEQGNDISSPNYDWISISQTQTDKISITFAPNNASSSRTVILVGTATSNGVSGIGGSFTQACIQRAWYADSDGDGFRDPGSVAEMDCFRTGNWTTDTTVDVCPSEYNLNNILVTWYRDTDGDNFKDPGGEVREQCSEPTDGNWTSNPESVDDNCPNHPYSTNAGCDPNCNITLPQNTLLDFDQQGGQLSVTFGVPQNCSGYELSFENVPVWVTDIYQNSNTIVVVVDATTEFREVGIPVYSNGSIQGGIGVRQNYDSSPPDPSDTCTANPIGNVAFGAFAESQTVTVTFEDPANCSGTTYLKHPYEVVPSWLTITPSGNTFSLSVGNNASGNERSTILVPVKEDAMGNITFVGQFFTVTQANCLTEWFPDTDGDTLGDVYALSEKGCFAPNHGGGITWVSNNDDLCPDYFGTVQNQGCPSGQVPENRNTITSSGFDIDDTLKGTNKAYFNEFGKQEQSQSLDILTNRIWASETIYDSEGRPAIHTLSAPTDNTSFLFRESFTLNTAGNEYSRNDFETDLNNPSPIAPQPNTLGWYYSNQNTNAFYIGNDYQDITEYPFSRTTFSRLNPDIPLKVIGGNKPDTNKDGSIDANDEYPQSYIFSMRASQELSGTVAFGDTKYDLYKINKTVSRNAQGNENVVFADADGKILATARSGGQDDRTMVIPIGEQGYVDIHVPEGNNMGFTIDSAGESITVYDLITENSVTPSANMSKGFYRVSVDQIDGYVPNSASVTYKENYYDYSLNEYDEAGRVMVSYQPLGSTKALKQSTSYEYDALGQLIHTTSPDEGEAWFKYRKDGQIRFSQNSKQKDIDPNDPNDIVEFSYTNYDFKGRPLESGILRGLPFGPNLDPNDKNLPASGTKAEKLNTTYDVLTSSELSTLPTGYQTPSYLSGNVVKTENSISKTYYSYDIYGRVKWMVQEIADIGFKTIDYEYDPVSGLVVKVIYQKNDPSERFIQKYEYNQINQLVKVKTSLDDSDYMTQAEYKYYETGGLRRVELANGVQGIDYVYNISGQLKAINDPELNGTNDQGQPDNDLFGMQLDYHNADYKRTIDKITATTYGEDQYSGGIKGIRWNNKQFEDSSTNAFQYDYNRNNWLKEALYGTYGDDDPTLEDNNDFIGTYSATDGVQKIEGVHSVTIKPTSHFTEGSDVLIRIVAGGGFNEVNGDYNVTGIEYDANGNILKLNRNKNTTNRSNAMDNLSYTYDSLKPNQLKRVDDANGDVDDADDIGDQIGDGDDKNYHYNEIGQLVEDWEYVTEAQRQSYLNTGAVPSSVIRYKYNSVGLVTEVTKNNVTLVKFFYNERNHRIQKKSFDGNGNLFSNTYYVRDAAGSVVAIHSIPVNAGTPALEYPIQGNGRIGIFKRSGNTGVTDYEITDHLGNVRAVFSVANNTIGNQNFSDYYPFGMPMPGRNMVGDYRYAFQGQEKDNETGKEAFQLRLWDGRIGRWLTTDPYGQHASPYLGMGNNPVRLIDPDGGLCQDADGNTIPCDGVFGGENFNGPTNETLTLLDEFVGTAALSASNRMNEFVDNSILFGGYSQANILFTLLADNTYKLKSLAQLGRFDPKFQTDFLNKSLSTKMGNVYSKDALSSISKLNKGLKFLGKTSLVAGYYSSAKAFYDGDNYTGVVEGTANTAGIEISYYLGIGPGLGWTAGWEGGKVFWATDIGQQIRGKYMSFMIPDALLPVQYRSDYHSKLLER